MTAYPKCLLFDLFTRRKYVYPTVHETITEKNAAVASAKKKFFGAV